MNRNEVGRAEMSRSESDCADVSRRARFRQLSKEYSKFIYRGYTCREGQDSLDLTYHFAIDGLSTFSPTWSIAKLRPASIALCQKKLAALVFSLGMVELISYWKLTCPPNIVIEQAGVGLTPEQARWWQKLYSNGLGEFFYTNGIPQAEAVMGFASPQSENRQNDGFHSGCPRADCLVTEKASADSPTTTESATAPLGSVMIPIGGGKDSCVSLELLRDWDGEKFCYIINPRQASWDTVQAAGLQDKTIVANRTLDTNMLELNKKGFLNGHTPFSALVAFSSVIAAYINGIEYVARSNELRGNDPKVSVGDVAVNHQYSKSYEFERDFIEYEKRYINSGVKYFSILRPLLELQIAKQFAAHKKYHSLFRSCNAASKVDAWCGLCPKCLFVYVILSPFMARRELIEVFGKDLLADEGLATEVWSLTPEMLGLGAAVISIGYNYNFWGIGALNNQETFDGAKCII